MAVLKIIELVGTSTRSWQEAVESAIERAALTIKNIRGVDVLGWTAKVQENKIIEYSTNVKISFIVD